MREIFYVAVCIFRSDAAATDDLVSNAILHISKTQSTVVKPTAVFLYGNHVY
jgi:hypothetical protein